MKKIYYNGDILTMENSDYEAIYVEDGVIKKCGNYSEIKNLVCADTEFIDLQGKCLMPSFIDSHSHVVSLASTLKLVDLSKATIEEHLKGSIKEGKKADLLILDRNPCKVAIEEIRQIKIIETIKDGITIYKKDI